MAREISSQEISPPLPAASAQQSPDTVSDAAASIAPYFRKMGIRLDGTENLRLLQAIAQWMGTPYQWGGCSPYGIDCSCLVKFIYETVYGISLHRTSVTMFENDLTPVPPEELREGDVLSFDTKGSGISHVGIYLKANRFVHASLSRGVMISSLDQSYFKKRFISGGRVVRHPAIRLASLSLGELVIVNP
ncbi:glycoside hydrolase [Desulfonema ishimotonii]|uniref:Glycoside hydrolase n=2 Tax=Desulfonema ishimotonii TaxID=45657 RepID=A0A401FT54_9BACT|nr:glycoside hydrolase [Desulfonema ishimotonii]